jgi:hypothetical protein
VDDLGERVEEVVEQFSPLLVLVGTAKAFGVVLERSHSTISRYVAGSSTHRETLMLMKPGVEAMYCLARPIAASNSDQRTCQHHRVPEHPLALTTWPA